MNKFNLTQNKIAQCENNLMWLKRDGYTQNKTEVQSFNLKERRPRFNNEESLSWLKRDDGDLLQNVSNYFHEAAKTITSFKALAVCIVLIVLSLFINTNASAQNLTLTASTTNVSCNGGSNGSIDMTLGIGNPPIFWIWNNGSTTEDLSGLSAGTYTVTATDGGGQTATSSSTITEPTVLNITSTTPSTTCQGSSNGVASLTAGGGSPPYSYLWSNSQTTATATGLAAGNYTATVTDDNGCTTTTSVVISQSAQIIILDSITNVSCNGGSNGSIATIWIYAEFEFIWSNGQTTTSIAGLTAGTYTVTVTNTSGCTASKSMTVTEPSALGVTQSYYTLPCTGLTNVTATATGGNSTYSYNWGNGGTNATITVTSTGTYPVTVTDPLGCTATSTIYVPVFPLLSVSLNYSGCCLYPTVLNGLQSYSYNWAGPNGFISTLESPCNLAGGTYTVTVTDANGCTGTAAISITGCCVGNLVLNGGFTNGVTITYNNSIGQGATVANWTAAYASPQVSQLPGCDDNGYVYMWGNKVVGEAIQQTLTSNILNGHKYQVSFCARWNSTLTPTTADQFVRFLFRASNATLGPGVNTSDVNNPPVLSVIGTSVNISNTGTWLTYTLPVWTATSNYTVLTISPTNSSNLNDGDYVSWGEIDNICITEVLNSLSVNFSDECDSTVCAHVTGGVPPYSFQWNTIPILTDSCINNVAPCNNVTVTVTDANGTAVTVTHKKALMTAVVTDVTCNNNNGAINFSIDCIDINCQPLTYLWSNSATTQDIFGLSAGTYCVTVYDACGNTYHCCYVVKCACVWNGCIKYTANPASLTAIALTTPAPGCTFTYYWKTNNGNMFTGKTWNNPPSFSSVTLKVVSCCGDTVTKTYSQFIWTNLTKTDPCCNPNDGTVTLFAFGGGSQPCAYTYTWQKANLQTGPWLNVAGTTNVLSNASAGFWYRVTVSDCCGNSFTTAPIKMGLYLSFTVTNVISTPSECLLFNGNVSFKVNSTCAAITYSYSYYPFPNCTCLPPAHSVGQQSLNLTGNTASISGLAPGTYTFFVIRCGVMYTVNAVVHFKAPTLKLRYTNCGTNVCIETNTCCNPTTYNWKLGGVNYGNQTQCRSIGTPFNFLHTGSTYTAKVTDCEGQFVQRNITIPTVTASIKKACGTSSDGKITIGVSNFGSPLQYSWDGGLTWSTSNVLSNKPAGTYCLQIRNSFGDIWECCYTIQAAPGVSFVFTNNGCRGKCVNVQTGLAPFNITWSPCGQQISVYNGSCYDQCGCYDVWVTDANGCTSSQQVTIEGVKINDNGNCGMCADMCGGCAPYNYVWSNGASSQCITCLSTGTYTVTVTDCNGATYTCSKSIVVNPLTAQLIGPQPGTNTIDIVVQGGCLPFTCTYDINSGAQQSLPQSLNPITTLKFLIMYRTIFIVFT